MTRKEQIQSAYRLTGDNASFYCDFKLRTGEEPMPYWPPVFSQGKGFK